MKYLILGILLLLQMGGQPGWAQEGRVDADPVRKFPPLRISIAPVYQQWMRDGASLQQVSFPVAAQFYVRPNLGVGIGFSQATAEGDGLERIEGVTDVQLAVNYSHQLAASLLVLNLGVDLPTGTRSFSEDAYLTAVQLAQSQYNFRVPFFGQGASISPGIAFVTPITGQLVTSLGVSYRLRGSFEPIDGFVNGYDWGNELLFTAGAVFQPDPTLSLSADAILTLYAADQVDGLDLYEPGRRITGQLQLHKALRQHDLWLTLRYRGIDNNTVFQGASIQARSIKAAPGFVRLSTQFGAQLRPGLRTTFQLEATSYTADFAFDQLTVFGAGVAPAIALTKAISMPLQVKYLFGDLEGFEAGVGLVAIL